MSAIRRRGARRLRVLPVVRSAVQRRLGLLRRTCRRAPLPPGRLALLLVNVALHLFCLGMVLWNLADPVHAAHARGARSGDITVNLQPDGGCHGRRAGDICYRRLPHGDLTRDGDPASGAADRPADGHSSHDDPHADPHTDADPGLPGG